MVGKVVGEKGGESERSSGVWRIGEANGGGAILVEKIGGRGVGVGRGRAAEGMEEEGRSGDEMMGIEWAFD